MSSITEIFLAAGEILYEEGDVNDCGFIIASGEIILYCDIDGQRIDIERRGPGAIVGELSILTGLPRAVTVEAVTECHAYRIASEQILTRFDQLDPLLRACVETSISLNGTIVQEINRPSETARLCQAQCETPIE